MDIIMKYFPPLDAQMSHLIVLDHETKCNVKQT